MSAAKKAVKKVAPAEATAAKPDDALEYSALSVLMENQPGALSRLVGLFSQRGYNIDSLCVAPTEEPTVSRLTLRTHGDHHVLEQINKQINKLVDVIKVQTLSDVPHVERELMLLKLRLSSARIMAMKVACDTFRSQIVDIFDSGYIIQIIGDSDKLDAFVRLWREDEIVEMSRTGLCGLVRGRNALEI